MEDEKISEKTEHPQFTLPNDHIEIELISQGAHGCIYRPNINCDTGEPEDINYISKIQTNSENIQNEINISNIIKTIDNYNYYFAPILSNCKTTISKIKESEIKKCKLLNPEEISGNTPSALKTGELLSTKMRYVGSNTLETYLLSLPSNKKDLLHKKIYSLFIYLLHSINLFCEKDIIHYDLKENNIMYDLNNNCPIMIDFGNTFVAKDIKTPEQRRAYFYSEVFYLYWPIEVQFLSYISVNNLYEKNIEESDIKKKLDDFINNLLNVQTKYNMYISKSELNDFKAKLGEFFKSYIGNPWEKMYTDFLIPELYKTWDLYALSATFLSSVYEVLKDKTPVNTINYTSSIPLTSNKTKNISENSTGSIMTNLTNFLTPKENKTTTTTTTTTISDVKSQTTIKGGDNTSTGENKSTISSIISSITGDTQTTSPASFSTAVSEIPIEYPEKIDLKGIISLKELISIWKSVFLSLPTERPTLDKIMKTTVHPKDI